MSIFKLIEDNWFTISLVASLLAFAIRMTAKYSDAMHNLSNSLNSIDNRMSENNDKLNDRINDIESLNKQLSLSIEGIESKRVSDSERTRIIMDGVEATLIVLSLQKTDNENDNSIKNSLASIQDYKSRKASM